MLEKQSKQGKIDRSRRKFFLNSGSALLAGYAFVKSTGLAQTVQRADSGRYQSIILNTHDYDAEIQERFDFPKDWQIDIMQMVGENNPRLTPEQIVQKLRSPIGSKPLREIAAGKENAVVTFDDISRATPVHLVAEHVVNELNAGGIDDDHILFIGAQGSHQDIPHEEAAKKLGPVFMRCPWMTHNLHRNCIAVGRTSWNNMIEANGYMVKADVKVLITGIKNHGGLGYSGGAKSVIPGVVSYNTIFYNHAVIGVLRKGNRSYEDQSRENTGSRNLVDNAKRIDAEEAADLLGIDFCVNIVQTGDRKVMNLFCGDVHESHLEAVRFAHGQIFWDNVPNGSDYDIVVTNSYPTSRYGPVSFGRVREGGTSVRIMQSPIGGSHYHHLGNSGRFDLNSWWDSFYRPRTSNNRQLVLSQYMSKSNIINSPGAEVHQTWDTILPILEQEHKGGAKVLLYPYQTVAMNPKECTIEGSYPLWKGGVSR